MNYQDALKKIIEVAKAEIEVLDKQIASGRYLEGWLEVKKIRRESLIESIKYFEREQKTNQAPSGANLLP
jgi:hypothetical protein